MGAEAPVQDDVVESVLTAARVLVAVSAQSVAEISDTVTLPQLRVLVVLASQPSMNLNGVATRIGVHPSNATRVVDRLVSAGLLDRRNDPADRRNLLLELTSAGNALVHDVMQRRRDTIATILEQMSPEERRQFGAGACAFVAAGGEFPSTAAWSLGWTTTPSAGSSTTPDEECDAHRRCHTEPADGRNGSRSREVPSNRPSYP